jgi:hypothetical protein
MDEQVMEILLKRMDGYFKGIVLLLYVYSATLIGQGILYVAAAKWLMSH